MCSVWLISQLWNQCLINALRDAFFCIHTCIPKLLPFFCFSFSSQNSAVLFSNKSCGFFLNRLAVLNRAGQSLVLGPKSWSSPAAPLHAGSSHQMAAASDPARPAAALSSRAGCCGSHRRSSIFNTPAELIFYSLTFLQCHSTTSLKIAGLLFTITQTSMLDADKNNYSG